MAVGMSRREKNSDGREDVDIYVEETYSPDIVRDLQAEKYNYYLQQPRQDLI